jgi:hypothetical protein
VLRRIVGEPDQRGVLPLAFDLAMAAIAVDLRRIRLAAGQRAVGAAEDRDFADDDAARERDGGVAEQVCVRLRPAPKLDQGRGVSAAV